MRHGIRIHVFLWNCYTHRWNVCEFNLILAAHAWPIRSILLTSYLCLRWYASFVYTLFSSCPENKTCYYRSVLPRVRSERQNVSPKLSSKSSALRHRRLTATTFKQSSQLETDWTTDRPISEKPPPITPRLGRQHRAAINTAGNREVPINFISDTILTALFIKNSLQSFVIKEFRKSVGVLRSQGLLSLYPVGAACAQWKIRGKKFLMRVFTEIYDSLRCNTQSSLPLLITTYLL